MNIPNALSLFRIALTPFFLAQLIRYQDGSESHRIAALCIFIVACLTDALDGFIARTFNQISSLGRFLDPLADKLMLFSGFFALLFVQNLDYQPPFWITLVILFREVVLTCALALVFIHRKEIEIEPNMLGKVTTFAQMLLLCFVLLKWPIAEIFCYITVSFTIASCWRYIQRDIHKLSGEI